MSEPIWEHRVKWPILPPLRSRHDPVLDPHPWLEVWPAACTDNYRLDLEWMGERGFLLEEVP